MDASPSTTPRRMGSTSSRRAGSPSRSTSAARSSTCSTVTASTAAPARSGSPSSAAAGSTGRSAASPSWPSSSSPCSGSSPWPTAGTRCSTSPSAPACASGSWPGPASCCTHTGCSRHEREQQGSGPHARPAGGPRRVHWRRDGAVPPGRGPRRGRARQRAVRGLRLRHLPAGPPDLASGPARRDGARPRRLRRRDPSGRHLERSARRLESRVHLRDQPSRLGAARRARAPGRGPALPVLVLVQRLRCGEPERRPRRDGADEPRDSVWPLEGARRAGRGQARELGLQPHLPAQCHGLRRLAAAARGLGRERPGRLGAHHRARDAEERRLAVASPRARGGPVPRLSRGAGGASRARAQRGLQRGADRRELPHARRGGARARGGAGQRDRAAGGCRARPALLPGRLRQARPHAAGLHAALERRRGHRAAARRVPAPRSPQGGPRGRPLSAHPPHRPAAGRGTARLEPALDRAIGEEDAMHAINGSARALCRFCDSDDTRTFVDLGMSPLCESFLVADALDRMEPFYPLDVFVCSRCLLVQLREYVSPQEIFGEYAYFSSYSDSWLAHAAEYTRATVARFGLDGASFVVELASNDGYLLRNFVARGIPCLGIEPAANVAKAAVAVGVPTHVDFFGRRCARELLARGRRADLIAGNNVLAQVPDLNDFVAGIALLLAPDGVVTLEFPHLLELIERNQFDTIYHEHFSYFSLLASERILAAHGLTVFDVEELPTHGGSLRLYAGHANATGGASAALDAVRKREHEARLDELSGYEGFAERVAATKRNLLAFLIEAKRAGATVAGYGAPGKGNTLLNYCGIRSDFLAFTVDRNPYKHGRYLPGTHVPIFPVEKLREARPDFILILPWNLRNEIAAQLAYAREWGARLVVPIPELEVF